MYHLAQLNIARMTMPYDDPGMQDFVNALDPVNEHADNSPGFVWRLKSDQTGDQALVDFEASGWLVNMSVWQDITALREFIKAPIHLAIMKRRANWFAKWPTQTMVLWWIEAGHIPAFEEAFQKLETLRKHGPSERAFTFGQAFDPPARAQQHVG